MAAGKKTLIRDRWRSGPRAIAALLPKVAAPALRRRGFASVELVTRWPEIVGKQLARDSMPERLHFPGSSRTGGTLRIRASGSMALELQHLEPLILEKINGYFGYNAVGRITILQGPPRKEPGAPPPPPPKLTPAEAIEVDAQTATIGEEHLRDALNRLGKAVKSAVKARKQPPE
jgi:hypothetical protein